MEYNKNDTPTHSNIHSHIDIIQSQITEYDNKESNSIGSLCNLFLSEYFTIDILLEYLIRKTQVGIIDFLSNMLFIEPFNSQTFFYIPQLCSLICSKEYTEPIQNYIISKSSEDSLFAVKAHWTLTAYMDDSHCNKIKLQRFISNIETHLINGPKHKSKENIDIQVFFDKQKKLNYFDNTVHIFRKIKQLCDQLKILPPQQSTTPSDKAITPKQKRKELLKNKLRKFNIAIKKMLEENSSNKFTGFLLPFDGYGKKSIVNFIPEYSSCFSSKARIPIKIACECVDLNEIPIEEEKIRVSMEISDRYYTQTIESSDDSDTNENKNQMTQELNREQVKKILDKIKYDNEHPNETDVCYNDIIDEENETNSNTNSNNNNTVSSEIPNLFKNEWSEIEKNIRNKSKFREYTSLSIVSFIAKSNDDLRQELLTMQLISQFDKIFKKANLPLKLRPYGIIITSSHSGIIEFLTDTLSFDEIKKSLLPLKITFNTFFREQFKDNFIQCQKNFAESLAAYSIVCYLIAIKDRHNGNILLDNMGNIIHIDFGFILGISPGGNLNFENAPFKLTRDYIQILDGVDSHIFFYFKSLITKGLIEARRHVESFVSMIEAMGVGVKMPCFNAGNLKEIINNLRERFMIRYSEDQIFNVVEEMVMKAVNSWRTTQYDMFQKLTNGIAP